MPWSPRGRPSNAPATFINPLQPTVASRRSSGPDWVHELKHDGYRLQIHVRDGRVRLYTMNGNDWTKRYPRIVKEAARLREPVIIDAEVVCLSAKGVADFDALHSRTVDENAVACAFDLLLAGDDIRRRPLFERKAELQWILRRSRGASSTSSTLRTMALRCSRPSASLAWKELSRRNSVRPTNPDHRKAGSRSRTRTPQPQLAQRMVRSNHAYKECIRNFIVPSVNLMRSMS